MKHLFKFCSGASAISILKNEVIFVTSPLDLNDPFEMRPAWTDEHENRFRKNEECRNKLTKGMPMFMAMEGDKLVSGGTMSELRPTPVMEVENQRGIADRHNGVAFKYLHENFRILSLVKDLFDLDDAGGESDENATLMWSHYADQFQGVCLALDATKFYNGIKSGGYEVAYPPERQSLAPSSYDNYLLLQSQILPTGHQVDPDSGLLLTPREKADKERHRIINFLSHKSPGWSYEREIRMLYELPELRQTSHYKQLEFPCESCRTKSARVSQCGEVVYRDALKLPSEAVRGVIFGADCTRATVDEVFSVSKTPKYSHVDFYWSALHSSRYAVQYIKGDQNYIEFIQKQRDEFVALAKGQALYTQKGGGCSS